MWPSHQWVLLSRPCHGDPAQFKSVSISLCSTWSPQRCRLPCPAVSWSPVASVAPWGHSADGTPPPTLGSVSQRPGRPLPRAPGGAALPQLWGSLLSSASRTPNLPLCLAVYRKRLSGGNFSFGSVTMASQRQELMPGFRPGLGSRKYRTHTADCLVALPRGRCGGRSPLLHGRVLPHSPHRRAGNSLMASRQSGSALGAFAGLFRLVPQ